MGGVNARIICPHCGGKDLLFYARMLTEVRVVVDGSGQVVSVPRPPAPDKAPAPSEEYPWVCRTCDGRITSVPKEDST